MGSGTPPDAVPGDTHTTSGVGQPLLYRDPLTLAEVLSYLAWGVALSADRLRLLQRLEELGPSEGLCCTTARKGIHLANPA
jgi:hypothetical protein